MEAQTGNKDAMWNARVQQVIKSCRASVETLPTELRYLGPHTSVLDTIEFSSNSAMQPCFAAAWVLWVSREARSPDGLGRLSEIASEPQHVPSNASDDWEPQSIFNLDLALAERLTLRAAETITEFKLPDPAELFRTGWEHWLSDESGHPSLAARWALLRSWLENVRGVVKRLPQRSPHDRTREPELCGCGPAWWDAIIEIRRLRWIVERVEEVLPHADQLQEQSVPLDQRWRPRAISILKEVIQCYGPSQDGPAVGNCPRAVGIRLVPFPTETLTRTDELIDRIAEMGTALLTYLDVRTPGNRANYQEAKPGEVWKTMTWFRRAVTKYTNGEAKFDGTHLTRKARTLWPVEWAKQDTPRGPYQFEVHAVGRLSEYSGFNKLFLKAIEDHFVPPLRIRKNADRAEAT